MAESYVAMDAVYPDRFAEQMQNCTAEAPAWRWQAIECLELRNPQSAMRMHQPAGELLKK